MSGVIHLQTEIPGPKSRALSARRAKAVPKGVPAVTPIAVVHAEGAVLTDADGNRLIDFGGGIGVVNTGHRHPGETGGCRCRAGGVPARPQSRLALLAIGTGATRGDPPDGGDADEKALRCDRRGCPPAPSTNVAARAAPR